MMIDKGIIEINGRKTEVGRKDIRRLKFILDEIGIMHVIDGVFSCNTPYETGREKSLYDFRTSGAEKEWKEPHKNRFRRQEKIQFRELKIPDFCLLDFISLTQLEKEQAEFLGDLVYGTQL